MLVTVGPDNQTGFRKHIEELAYCVEHPSKFIAVKTKGPESLKEIQELNPKLTIIGGANWIKRNHHILDEIPCKKGILFVGPLGQEEIAGFHMENFIFFMKLLDEGKVNYIFLGSKDLADTLNRPDVIYLPAPFVMEEKEYVSRPIPKKKIVSILNDKAPHKNTLNSMAGIARSKYVEEFRINGLPPVHNDLAQRFKLTPIMKDLRFLEKSEYYRQIIASKLLLHLSYAEGLCYGVLEALYHGVPILVTNAMPWFYHERLFVQNQANHKEIAQKIDGILSLNDKEYEKLCKECRLLAEKVIKEKNQIVRDALNGLLEGA